MALGSLLLEDGVLSAPATSLGACRPGSRVNLEIDLIARYVQRLLVREKL